MMMHRAVLVAAIVLAASDGQAAPRTVTVITADVYKQLSDLERARARADVRQATASAAVMERYINELKASAPTDTRSKGIVDKFRGWLDALLDAAGELERMSASDSAVDGVEAGCAALDSSLEQKVNELAAEGSATPAGKTAPTPPADHAPRGLLDAIEKTCWDAHSKRTSFTCTPAYYDRCERRVECVR